MNGNVHLSLFGRVKVWRLIGMVILSVLFATSLDSLMQLYFEKQTMLLTLLYAPAVVVICFAVLMQVTQFPSRRKLAYAFAFSVAFSVALVFGLYMHRYASIFTHPFRMVLQIGSLAIPGTFILCGLREIVRKFPQVIRTLCSCVDSPQNENAGKRTLHNEGVEKREPLLKEEGKHAKTRRSTWKRFVGWISGLNEKKSFLLCAGALLVCWLPLLIIHWPGIWTFDTIFQTQWLITDEPLSTHHPVLHSLWLSIPLYLSDAMFGSYLPGFAFYTISQMLSCAALAAGSLVFLKRWNIPGKLLAVFLAFYALFPCFAAWVVVATKDVFFSFILTFTLAYCLELYRVCVICHKPLERRQVVCLVALLLLTALFRNNFIYAFVVVAVLAFFLGVFSRKRIALVAGTVLVSYLVIMNPLMSAFGIIKGSSVEMFSVPAVQLATVANKAEGLSAEESEFIATYVPDWEELQPTIADTVKENFNVAAIKDDPLGFVKGYVKIGLEHPKMYTNAFLRLSYGFWAPVNIDDSYKHVFRVNMFVRGNRGASEDFPAQDYIYFERNDSGSQFLKELQASTTQVQQLVPVASTLLQTGFWLWLFVGCVMWAFYQRRTQLGFILLVFGFYWLTMLLGPVSIFRYFFPLFVFVPVLITCLVLLGRKGYKKE